MEVIKCKGVGYQTHLRTKVSTIVIHSR